MQYDYNRFIYRKRKCFSEIDLEKFKEPTRPLPKHIWNKLSGEDKKDRNSTCFDKKDP